MSSARGRSGRQHEQPRVRRRLFDHFVVVVCEGGAEPRVEHRFPLSDEDSSYELPPALPYFVTESFSSSSVKTAQHKKRWFGKSNDKAEAVSRFFPFVLTGASGERIYAGALTRSTVSPSFETLCILSRFPFFSLFHDVLVTIHALTRPFSNAEVAVIKPRRAQAPTSPEAGGILLTAALGRGPSGLVFEDSKGLVHVKEARGQAQAAGIGAGDELVAVGDDPTTAKSLLDLRAKFEKADLSTATLFKLRMRPDRADHFTNPLLEFSLEDMLVQIMRDTRLPEPGGKIELKFGPGREITYRRSQDSGAMPRVEDASFGILWRFLTVETVLCIMNALALEHRVVLVADDVALLAPIAEALLSFLSPLKWTHVYIPLLPTELLVYLEAPVPFFVGISSSYLSLDVVANVVEDDAGPLIAHLERNEVRRPMVSEIELPREVKQQLSSNLEKVSASFRQTAGLAVYGQKDSVASEAQRSASEVRRARTFEARLPQPIPETQEEGEGVPERAEVPKRIKDNAMDVDAARFHFLIFWVDLLFPISDFLKPHQSRELKHERRSKGEKKRTDDRDVHTLDADTFLSYAPPTWRQFLTTLVSTSLFQQLVHSACEEALHPSRDPKKMITFFHHLTTLRTHTEMRFYVEQSLSGDTPEDTPKAQLLDPSRSQGLFSYTAFPSLVAAALKSKIAAELAATERIVKFPLPKEMESVAEVGDQRKSSDAPEAPELMVAKNEEDAAVGEISAEEIGANEDAAPGHFKDQRPESSDWFAKLQHGFSDGSVPVSIWNTVSEHDANSEDEKEPPRPAAALSTVGVTEAKASADDVKKDRQDEAPSRAANSWDPGDELFALYEKFVKNTQPASRPEGRTSGEDAKKPTTETGPQTLTQASSPSWPSWGALERALFGGER